MATATQKQCFLRGAAERVNRKAFAQFGAFSTHDTAPHCADIVRAGAVRR